MAYYNGAFDSNYWSRGGTGIRNSDGSYYGSYYPTDYIDPLAGINREYRWKWSPAQSTPPQVSTPTVSTPQVATPAAPTVPQAGTLPQVQPRQHMVNNPYYYGTYDRNDPNMVKAMGNAMTTGGSLQDAYANQLGGDKPGLFESIGNGLLDNFTSNPLGFAGGLFNMWQGFQNYKYLKDNLALQKDAYETNKQVLLDNQRRANEQWDMLKRQRASSSL